MPDFVHLHVHSQYSMLEGAIRMKELCGRVKEMGMPAVALTDHGNMHGAIDFYKKAKDAGIQAIVGCEMGFGTSSGDKPAQDTGASAHAPRAPRREHGGLPQPHRSARYAWVDGDRRTARRASTSRPREEHARASSFLTGCMGGLCRKPRILQQSR